MKTVVCGLGKCGSRMTLDLNAMIWGGKYSYELRVEDGAISKSKFGQWLKKLFKPGKGISQYIREEERPALHLGDPDGQNEVLSLIQTASSEQDKAWIREDLKDQVIKFTNYTQACGQYHIVGEHVMRDLLRRSDDVKRRVVDSYIKANDPENVSSYLLMFSAGGGTGCGTSTILAENIAARARQEYANLLVAGIAVLPGASESENYKVSAGRFLTKFLSSERATSFDTVITVSNSIMEGLNKDEKMVQSQANAFAAHLICSLINSSSKFNLSPVNTDGPELRKNIHGLSYFCYSQTERTAENEDQIALDLLSAALQPVSKTPGFDDDSQQNISFQGASISLSHPRFFPPEKWEELQDKIAAYAENARSLELGDKPGLKKILNELFPNPEKDLPLAMRSCSNVVVLRGIPEKGGKSTQWEQTALVAILETIFPKANIHYYSTYHKMGEDTFLMLPSGYISHELFEFINAYLANVWEKKLNRKRINELLISQNPVTEEEIAAALGDREHFECKYNDFRDMVERTSGWFGLDDTEWEDNFVSAAQVAAMLNNVHGIVANVKRVEPEPDADDGADDPLDI